MIIYFFIAYKLAVSADVDELLNNQLVMGNIAIQGSWIIPLGLAASTISSALGSVMVAPRTLQALASDRAFPNIKINRWLAQGREKDNEPTNSTIVTLIIAFVFVALGNVNTVAEIISMFFMVTYGALCLISVLNHFGSSPSYRPSYNSKWYLSLIGFVVSIWVMFKINTGYALLAFLLMTALYQYINYTHKYKKRLCFIILPMPTFQPKTENLTGFSYQRKKQKARPYPPKGGPHVEIRISQKKKHFEKKTSRPLNLY